MKLVCYYCSKEVVLPFTLVEEEEKLKGSIWFCSDFCKETYVNIQIHRKRNGEEEELQ